MWRDIELFLKKKNLMVREEWGNYFNRAKSLVDRVHEKKEHNIENKRCVQRDAFRLFSLMMNKRKCDNCFVGSKLFFFKWRLVCLFIVLIGYRNPKGNDCRFDNKEKHTQPNGYVDSVILC